MIGVPDRFSTGLKRSGAANSCAGMARRRRHAESARNAANCKGPGLDDCSLCNETITMNSLARVPFPLRLR
ncbi:MAG: hypothetical protein WAT70_12300 [Rhizobiaceae bacterium]